MYPRYITSHPRGVTQNAQLRREVGFRVLSIVEDFMTDFAIPLSDEKNEYMSLMFPLIGLLLQIDHSVSFLRSLYATIRYFIYTFRKVRSSPLYPESPLLICGTGSVQVEKHQLLWRPDLGNPPSLQFSSCGSHVEGCLSLLSTHQGVYSLDLLAL